MQYNTYRSFNSIYVIITNCSPRLDIKLMKGRGGSCCSLSNGCPITHMVPVTHSSGFHCSWVLYLGGCLPTDMYLWPKSIFTTLLLSLMGKHKVAKRLSSRPHKFPAEVEQGDSLPSCFGSPTVNNVFFTAYLMLQIFQFCVFGWWHFCLKMGRRNSAEMLFLSTRRLWHASQRKCLCDDKLPSGMSSSTVGCVFKSNQSRTCIRCRLCISWLAKHDQRLTRGGSFCVSPR